MAWRSLRATGTSTLDSGALSRFVDVLGTIIDAEKLRMVKKLGLADVDKLLEDYVDKLLEDWERTMTIILDPKTRKF